MVQLVICDISILSGVVLFNLWNIINNWGGVEQSEVPLLIFVLCLVGC